MPDDPQCQLTVSLASVPSLLALIEVQTRQEVAVDYALELNSEVEEAQSSCYRSS